MMESRNCGTQDSKPSVPSYSPLMSLGKLMETDNLHQPSMKWQPWLASYVCGAEAYAALAVLVTGRVGRVGRLANLVPDGTSGPTKLLIS